MISKFVPDPYSSVDQDVQNPINNNINILNLIFNKFYKLKLLMATWVPKILIKMLNNVDNKNDYHFFSSLIHN